jgi:hypothetical protein
MNRGKNGFVQNGWHRYHPYKIFLYCRDSMDAVHLKYPEKGAHSGTPLRLSYFSPKTQYHISILIIILLLLSACTASASPEVEPTSLSPLATLEAVDLPLSAWGQVELIAQAENRDAPVFMVIEDEALVFSWTGSQENEARLYSRGIIGNAQIMPLKAFFPFQQELFANPQGILMLWLDRTVDDEDIRLQMAQFNRGGVATLGPGNVSDLRTRNYSARLMDDGDLLVVWSGGIGSVSNLYLQRVDSRLRMVGNSDLRVDADYPALVKDGGNLYLFWLEDNGRAVYSGRIEDDSLNDIQRIARTNIAGTVAIDYFTAGFDGKYVYLFWNLRQIDGTRQVLFSSALIGEADFSRPTILGISVSDNLDFETIYAIDNVRAAQLDADNRVAWAVPASKTAEMLPVVINLGQELAVVFFQDGQLVAYQAVVESGALIGLPNIQILKQNHLAISWSQPSKRAYANLFFSSTQP